MKNQYNLKRYPPNPYSISFNKRIEKAGWILKFWNTGQVLHLMLTLLFFLNSSLNADHIVIS